MKILLNDRSVLLVSSTDMHRAETMFAQSITKHLARRCKTITLTQKNYSAIVQDAFLINDNGIEDEWNRALPYEKMPDMGSLPLLGNRWRALPIIGYLDLNRIHESMKQIYFDHGPCVKITNLLGDSDMVLVYDPKDIEKIMRTETNRSYLSTTHYYKYVLRKEFFGENKGVIDVDHEDWKKFRPKVQREMLDPKIIKLYTNQLTEVADSLVQKVKMIRDDYDETENFSNEIRAWALESIGVVALDVRLGCLDPKIESNADMLLKAVNAFNDSITALEFHVPFWKFFNTPTWKQLVQSLDTFREVVTMYTEKTLKQDYENKDIDSLSLIQRLAIANKNDPSVIFALAFDMFLVGIDTTSYSMGNLLYQLSQNQQAQEILFKEILSVLPHKDSPIDSEALQKMPYLKACIKENLRMNPVLIGNLRTLANNHVLQGYQVHKGTQVCFPHHTLTNSNEYFRNSDKFQPERWLNYNYNECPEHKFAYLPFGFGKRMCLGKRIVDLEGKIFISKLIRNFKLEYRHKKLECITQPLLKLEDPFRLALIDRK